MRSQFAEPNTPRLQQRLEIDRDHALIVAQRAPLVKPKKLRNTLTTGAAHYATVCIAMKPPREKARQPRRPHFIPQWAATRGLKKADLARALDTDKSLISRWYNGSSPSLPWQQKLASYFGVSRESLFRDPDEDWIHGVMADRSPEERARIRATIEAAFLKK